MEITPIFTHSGAKATHPIVHNRVSGFTATSEQSASPCERGAGNIRRVQQEVTPLLRPALIRGVERVHRSNEHRAFQPHVRYSTLRSFANQPHMVFTCDTIRQHTTRSGSASTCVPGPTSTAYCQSLR